MVVFIHDDNDACVGAEYGVLYDTRTLHSAERVTEANRAKVLEKLLALNICVVVPTDFRRITRVVNDVTIALRGVGRTVISVEAYLQQLNRQQPPTATAAPAAHEHRVAVG